MAVAATLFCLAPVSPAERIHALLMSGFLLQLGVCDAASGWLPRRMTVTFLVAGLLATGMTDSPLSALLIRPAITGLMTLILLYSIPSGQHTGKLRRMGDILGTGDLWMITGMVAWLGLPGAMMALITALAGFVARHLTVGTGMRAGGPLGPWLSAGCVLILIQWLYQPLWVV